MQARTIIPTLLMAGGLAGPAAAQEMAAGWSIGAVLGSTQSAYVGRSQRTGIAPILSYEGERFTLGVNGLGVKVFDGSANKLSFHLAPRLSPLKDPSEPELAGIDRDHSLDLAVVYEYRASRQFGTFARVSKGINAAQNGVEVKVAARGAFSAGPVPLLVSAGASWKSAELSQYYYGVNASEVAVGRAAYTVGTTTTPFLSIGSSMPLGDNTRLFGSVRADFFGSAITNSPIVTRSTVVSAALGLTYSF